MYLVGAAYLFFNLSFAPGGLGDSLKATGIQILSTAPYIIGLTVLVVYFIQRIAGERPPWDRIFRIYCTIGIIIGLLFGIQGRLTLN